MKTVILAAGYATRLYPLTRDTPKALLKVGRKTILEHLLDRCPPPSDAVIVTNARFAPLFEAWRKSADASSVRILNDGTTSNENRLGAVGDLRFAIKRLRIREDLLVLASDNLFDENLSRFIAFGAGDGGRACVGVVDLKDPKLLAGRYGAVVVGEKDPSDAPGTGRVRAIEEKSANPSSALASMGVYYFPAASLSHLEAYLAGVEKPDAPGYYVAWLAGRIPVYAVRFSGRWFDIGSVDQWEEASRTFAVY